MSTLLKRLKNIGPGALVAAAFIGPGTVTTCTLSGANYGYTLVWAIVFATVATIVFQEMAARIGIATQKGLAENIRDRIKNPVAKWIALGLVLVAIFIGNVAYETGNITGGILGIGAIVDVAGGLQVALIIAISVCAAALLWIGSFKAVQNVLTVIVVLMGVVFMITAFASNPDWGAVFAGLMPHLPSTEQTGGTSPVLVAVGLIGTTVVPYNLFLHASSAADRWKNPEDIADARFDSIISIGLGGFFSLCILICAAANIYGTGIEVTNGATMAVALTQTLGGWATILFGIGLFAAGFTSAITAPLAAAYATSGALGWGRDMKNIKFKLVWLIVILCGCFMAIALSKSPTQLILTAQAANAIILPLMAFFVLYCANSKDLGSLRNKVFANAFGVVIIVVTLFMCYRNLSSFWTSLMSLLGIG